MQGPFAVKDLKKDLIMKTLGKIDEFTQAYIACMFWTEEEEIGGELAFIDLSEDDQSDIKNECISFYQANAKTMTKANEDFSQHGHDFWLTRNGHGAGFWDRGYSKELGDLLTAQSERYKSAYLTRDGEKIYYHSDSKVGTWDE